MKTVLVRNNATCLSTSASNLWNRPTNYPQDGIIIQLNKITLFVIKYVLILVYKFDGLFLPSLYDYEKN